MITIDLSATQQGARVLVEAFVEGSGVHDVELQGFNVGIETTVTRLIWDRVERKRLSGPALSRSRIRPGSLL